MIDHNRDSSLSGGRTATLARVLLLVVVTISLSKMEARGQYTSDRISTVVVDSCQNQIKSIINAKLTTDSSVREGCLCIEDLILERKDTVVVKPLIKLDRTDRHRVRAKCYELGSRFIGDSLELGVVVNGKIFTTFNVSVSETESRLWRFRVLTDDEWDLVEYDASKIKSPADIPFPLVLMLRSKSLCIDVYHRE